MMILCAHFICIPLIWLMVKGAVNIITDKNDLPQPPNQPMYLNNNMIEYPTAAIRLLIKEIARCGKLTGEIIKASADMAGEDTSGVFSDITEMTENEAKLKISITEYISQLAASGNLTDEQEAQITILISLLNDIERVGEICFDTAVLLRDAKEMKFTILELAGSELQFSLNILAVIYARIIEMMKGDCPENMDVILDLRARLRAVVVNMRKNYMNSMENCKCSPEQTMLFNEIMSNISGLGNICLNMAENAVQVVLNR